MTAAADLIMSLRLLLDAGRSAEPDLERALTARFKPQLRTPEHKQAFTKLVKKVARLEEVPPGSGTRCIVLK